MLTPAIHSFALALRSQLRLPLSEGGQTLVEYALIILFVAIALIVALETLAGGLNGFYHTAADALP